MMVAAAATWRDRPRGTSVTIRVFLLDDHEVVRRGVRDLLEAQSDGDVEVAGEAAPPRRPTAASRPCDPTLPSSTYACPMVTGSRSAARSALVTPRSSA
jgi:hypothetical protein